MRILIVGDVYSAEGRDVLERNLAKLRSEMPINFIIVNGENIAHGAGINERYYRFLINQQVNVVTLGNHAFNNNDIFNFISEADHLVRPLNFPEGVPGKGYVTINYNHKKITVFQVVGRTFIPGPWECPFRATEKLLKEVPSDLYICDFHGEATSDKIAYGLYFDGRIQVIFGTHTHVQTNDARILKNGTMYITDVGMTGSLEGVIGVQKEMILKKMVLGLPSRHMPAEGGLTQFCGMIVDINENTKKVTSYDILNIIE